MVDDTLSLSSCQNFWSQIPFTILKIIEDLNLCIEAYLRRIVAPVPDHHNKANVTLSQMKCM